MRVTFEYFLGNLIALLVNEAGNEVGRISCWMYARQKLLCGLCFIVKKEYRKSGYGTLLLRTFFSKLKEEYSDFTFQIHYAYRKLGLGTILLNSFLRELQTFYPNYKFRTVAGPYPLFSGDNNRPSKEELISYYSKFGLRSADYKEVLEGIIRDLNPYVVANVPKTMLREPVVAKKKVLAGLFYG